MLFTFSEKDVSVSHLLDEHPLKEQYVMHAHEQHELYCFLSGQGSYYVEGSEYPLSPGCVMVMRAGETHCLHINPGQPYERIVFNFSQAALQGIAPAGRLLRPFVDRPLGVRNLYRPEALGASAMQALCGTFAGAEQSGPRGPGEDRLLTLTTLLSALYALGGSFARPEPEPASGSEDVIRQVVSYINLHLDEPLSLHTLSDRFFLSRSRLSSRFRQITGSTVWDYIAVKRLMLARRRIREGASALAAAEESGWNDYSTLCRQSRPRCGASPLQDRLRNKDAACECPGSGR